MRWRHAVVAILTALAVGSLPSLPFLSRLDGYSIDILFWLRHVVQDSQYDAADSPTAVIAIDEETYRRPPFKGLPTIMWTKQLAEVIDATLEGGAAVIGQDLVLTASMESHLPNFDRSYLLALRKAGREGRIVLGQLQHSYQPISPFAGYSFAVGHGRNIRLLNLFKDDDDVIRRIPLRFRAINDSGDGGGGAVPSMAVELAARASGAPLTRSDDGGWALGDYRIPAASGAGGRFDTLLLNFDTGPGGIPVYSMADIHACAQAGRGDFFREHFAGRVVLVGTVLDVEDRKITSKRFATGSENDLPGKRCILDVMPDLAYEDIVRQTIPGVMIHATAVNNLLNRNPLRDLPAAANWALTVILAGLAAFIAFSLSPWIGVFAVVGAGLLWTGAAITAFDRQIVLLLLDPLLGAVATFGILVGYRFGVADREKRMIRRAFAFYLPDPVIERMTRRDRMPTLGGETRHLSVWFSDLAGFTPLSEQLTPTEIVSLLNLYLTEMTDLVEAHGGFVEKYIGDAIVAVFGAPLDDPDHGLHAVQAALACQARLQELQSSLPLPAGTALRARIGINSGDILIGNIGSKRRFNYTIMGDAVNLAARLEGVNKVYGTATLVSESTVALCDTKVRFREIDQIRVVGRRGAVRIFEPLAPSAAGSDIGDSTIEPFTAALETYRKGRFKEAAAAFAALSKGDPVAAALAARADALALDPPGAKWDGITDLTSK